MKQKHIYTLELNVMRSTERLMQIGISEISILKKTFMMKLLRSNFCLCKQHRQTLQKRTIWYGLCAHSGEI